MIFIKCILEYYPLLISKIEIIFFFNYSGGPFEFSIPGSSEYTVLPLTRLHGTCQIVKKDGSPIYEDVDYAIVNLFSTQLPILGIMGGRPVPPPFHGQLI